MKRKWLITFSIILLILSCSDQRAILKGRREETDDVRQIILLYTNDEHGWMEGTEGFGGAAEMMGVWQQKEGYSSDGPFLILSGGDNWTGPAISTAFKGESMVDVMNAMEYTATAIGNHEFDFKVAGLKERISQANFLFLSANIREKQTGDLADFAQPYVIKEVNGIKVGLIGLTTTSTPVTTFPDNVADYDFIPYKTALEEVVPKVKNDGAELLVVIGHICHTEMTELLPVATRLGISVIGGGHCNELIGVVRDGVAIIEGGAFMRNYAKVKIAFDTVAHRVVNMEPTTHDNVGGTPVPNIAAVVSNWKSRVDAEFSQVIGYVNQAVEQRSNAMFNMITDSWLISFPTADVSLTNRGGIRQTIPGGNITSATLLGVLPFDNFLLELDLTGAQLVEDIGNLVIGGMTTIGGHRLFDGTPIHPDSTYRVLTTDFLYSLPTLNFKLHDSEPVELSINYRQPVIDWIKSLNTSQENPLDKYLEHESRR